MKQLITATELHKAFLDDETEISPCWLSFVSDEPYTGDTVTVDGEINFQKLADWVNQRVGLIQSKS